MDTSSFNNILQLMIEIGIIVAIGAIVITLLIRIVRIFAQRVRLSPMVLEPVYFVIRILGAVIILSLILNKFGVNLFTILSTILALIAVGFVAVWSILSNFLSTWLLIILKPFSIDDTVEFPGEPIKGKVVALTPLYTTLQNAEGEYYQVPNSLFFQKTIKRKAGEKPVDLGEKFEVEEEQ